MKRQCAATEGNKKAMGGTTAAMTRQSAIAVFKAEMLELMQRRASLTQISQYLWLHHKLKVTRQAVHACIAKWSQS